MPYPIVHLYVAGQVQKMLGKDYHLDSFLWGAVATDCNNDDLVENPIERTHTHIKSDDERKAFLKSAKGSDEKAFCVGYLTHLIADDYWGGNIRDTGSSIRRAVDNYLQKEYDFKGTGVGNLTSPKFFGKGDAALKRYLEQKTNLDSGDISSAVRAFKGAVAGYAGYSPKIRAKIAFKKYHKHPSVSRVKHVVDSFIANKTMAKFVHNKIQNYL
jgi:hypothetical protein